MPAVRSRPREPSRRTSPTANTHRSPVRGTSSCSKSRRSSIACCWRSSPNRSSELLLKRPVLDRRVDQGRVILHKGCVHRAVLLVARIAGGGLRKCLGALGARLKEVEGPSSVARVFDMHFPPCDL